jgi:hypothetical protein
MRLEQLRTMKSSKLLAKREQNKAGTVLHRTDNPGKAAEVHRHICLSFMSLNFWAGH